MTHSLFTSEAVAAGHPDKIADQISDAILDACLAADPASKVACETMVAGNRVFIAGEITTSAKVDYEAVARKTIEKIGYDKPSRGFDHKTCEVTVAINNQSADIALGVNSGTGLFQDQGAGDQGMMFGFACDETEELMPMPAQLSHKLMEMHDQLRRSGKVAYLGPDAKAQVTIEYDEEERPLRVHTIVISTMHEDGVPHAQIVEDMKAMITDVVPPELIDSKTLYYINPTGRFVVGGPVGDCGLTGRKIIVDTYGGFARHGGGAFSGKDPSKVDRSAAYAGRYVAKNIVAAGLARRCEVQVAYAIGVPHPVSIRVQTFGTGTISEKRICEAIPHVFDLCARGIEEMLHLRQPIYAQVAAGGHFGRPELDLPWEKTDRIEALKEAIDGKPSSSYVAK
jgi:S-adenosylmethionine synthetase